MKALGHLLCALLLVLAPGGFAAQGWMDKYVELGLSLPRLEGFESLPVQPGERFVALRFNELEELGTAGLVRASCLLVIVPHRARKSGDATSAQEYLERALPDWERKTLRGRRERFGYSGTCVALEHKREARLGHVQIWSGPERDLLWIGLCAREDAGRLMPVFRSVGERMSFREPREDPSERHRWERYYGHLRLSDPEGRIAVRLAMVEGWQAEDSEHYIVLGHVTEPLLLAEVAQRMEAQRRELSRSYPPLRGRGAAESVAAVRICRDRSEYLAYGGWKGSAGYWNPAACELVLYDPRATGGSEEDLWITVQHEATHQYIHSATGGLVPHPWFDEGLADWISGSKLEGGLLLVGQTHPWRVEAARAAAPRASLRELLEMPLDFFYSNAPVHYALAWSFLSFLESDRAQERSDYRGILPTYYRELQAASVDPRTRGAASGAQAARRAALRVALDDVDLDQLQEDWREYVRRLPPSAER